MDVKGFFRQTILRYCKHLAKCQNVIDFVEKAHYCPSLIVARVKFEPESSSSHESSSSQVKFSFFF